MTKSELRTSALAARRALYDGERKEKSIRICENLLRLPEMERAGLILAYRALWDEVDLSFLPERAGVRVAYPLCLDGERMEARIPTGPLRKGRYGIDEPDTEASISVAPGELDIVIVPCVAFDARGGRIGHGAGYYDRYLPLCVKAHFIAVAFEAQRLRDIPEGPRDVRMDCVVTEDGVFRVSF